MGNDGWGLARVWFCCFGCGNWNNPKGGRLGAAGTLADDPCPGLIDPHDLLQFFTVPVHTDLCHCGSVRDAKVQPLARLAEKPLPTVQCPVERCLLTIGITDCELYSAADSIAIRCGAD